MAETYEGLYVKFGANTVEFDNSVKGINKANALLKKDLSSINNQLKFDPDNVDLLTEKMQNFGEQLRISGLKVAELREKQNALGTAKIGTEEWQKLESEIRKTESTMQVVERAINATKNSLANVTSDPIKNLNNTIKETSENLKLIDRELKLDPSNIDLLDSKMELFGKQVEATELKIEQLKREQEQLGDTDIDKDRFKALAKQIKIAEIEAKELNASIEGIGDEINELSSNGGSKFGGMFDELKESIGGAAGDIPLIGSSMTGTAAVAVGAAAGVVTAVAAIGAAAVGASQEFNNATSKIQNSIGATDIEVKSLGDSLNAALATGLYESAEEAAQAIIDVKQNIKGLNDEDLTKVTSYAKVLGNTFDLEVNESSRAASQIMKTFKVDAEGAFDVLAYGMQNGANASMDLIDTFTEYSGLVSEAGFSAQGFVDILITGLDAGARNTDLVADAIKEVQIRLKDRTIQESLSSFSTGTQNVIKQWETGGATLQQVFLSIAKDIGNAQSGSKQYQALIGAVGTQFEDLGQQAAIALGSTATSTNASRETQRLYRNSVEATGSSLTSMGIKGQNALKGINNETNKSKGSIENMRKTALSPLSAEWIKLKKNGSDALKAIGNSITPVLTGFLKLANKISDIIRQSKVLKEAIKAAFNTTLPGKISKIIGGFSGSARNVSPAANFAAPNLAGVSTMSTFNNQNSTSNSYKIDINTNATNAEDIAKEVERIIVRGARR